MIRLSRRRSYKKTIGSKIKRQSAISPSGKISLEMISLEKSVVQDDIYQKRCARRVLEISLETAYQGLRRYIRYRSRRNHLRNTWDIRDSKTIDNAKTFLLQTPSYHFNRLFNVDRMSLHCAIENRRRAPWQVAVYVLWHGLASSSHAMVKRNRSVFP